MLRWGILLILIGALSLALPPMGYDLRIMRLFGGGRLIVEIVFIVAGAVLVGLSFRKT